MVFVRFISFAFFAREGRPLLGGADEDEEIGLLGGRRGRLRHSFAGIAGDGLCRGLFRDGTPRLLLEQGPDGHDNDNPDHQKKHGSASVLSVWNAVGNVATPVKRRLGPFVLHYIRSLAFLPLGAKNRAVPRKPPEGIILRGTREDRILKDRIRKN